MTQVQNPWKVWVICYMQFTFHSSNNFLTEVSAGTSTLYLYIMCWSNCTHVKDTVLKHMQICLSEPEWVCQQAEGN